MALLMMDEGGIGPMLNWLVGLSDLFKVGQSLFYSTVAFEVAILTSRRRDSCTAGRRRSRLILGIHHPFILRCLVGRSCIV